ncbi:MAG: site-2 protease family protein [Myxococcota bacterium]
MNFDVEVMRSLPVWFVATLLSLTLHEAAHALIGRLGGDDTAESQVTLDPMPHIRREPIGMILVPIASFILAGGGWMIGWASAPYDPRWAARFPKKAALMAAAGPMGNFLLAAVGAGIVHGGIAWAGWTPSASPTFGEVVTVGGEATALTTFASVLFSVNVLLGLFNLLPVPPLDGHAVVPLFLNQRLTDKWFALFQERGASLMGMLIAWVIFGRIAWPIFVFSLNLLYPGSHYIAS